MDKEAFVRGWEAGYRQSLEKMAFLGKFIADRKRQEAVERELEAAQYEKGIFTGSGLKRAEHSRRLQDLIEGKRPILNLTEAQRARQLKYLRQRLAETRGV